MGHNRVAAVYDSRIISALIEHTHINTEDIGHIDGTLHSTFVRADDHQMITVKIDSVALLNQRLYKLVSGLYRIKAAVWNGVLYTRVMGVKCNDILYS